MRSSTLTRALAGAVAGVIVSIVVVVIVGAFHRAPTPPRLVPETASGALRRIAIHYVPAQDAQALPVWKQLFRALPPSVTVSVAVEREADFALFLSHMRAAGATIDRFESAIVGKPITTWSRDRMAALEGPAGILAPPRVTTSSGRRAGDWDAPFALARSVYGASPRIAPLVFEGGDLAASPTHVFADANLIGRNIARGDATRAHLEAALSHTFSQKVIWLGDHPGEVPEHHIMMYMVPLDARRVLVGNPRLGAELAPEVDADGAFADHVTRFDRVAQLLAAQGFEVTRIPVVVLPGAGSYVTYTNALFDRDARGPVVYLPTYGIPELDDVASSLYESLGYRVVEIDVSTIYRLNGSLGCLVNVMAR
ncbi:MAG: agmatine deiminase family protein [Kofleriaceae bacterium]